MNWDDFYIGLAFSISRKSPDSQTKHGCVIATQDNMPLGFGFNGFPRKANCEGLPTTRPQKYGWMRHAEKNALSHCNRRPENGIAYVTGLPCNDCIYDLWQFGVKHVVHADRPGMFNTTEEDLEWFSEFLDRTGMTVKVVKPDLNWQADLVSELEQLGFVTPRVHYTSRKFNPDQSKNIENVYNTGRE